jgi:outer membrane protein
MKKLIFLFFTFLSVFGPAYSSCPFDHPLTLAELIDTALENHPATKQAWWNANRAAAAVGSAKSACYPNISFDATLINGREFKFINGPNTSFTNVGANLYLSMLLYDFGERSANIDMAKYALCAANWQLDWDIQRVMVGVLENTYSTLYAQEVLQASRISLNEAEKVLNAAKELNRTGLTPKTDVYTAQAAFYQMKMDFAEQKASLDIQRGRLAASLGLPATTCFELAPIPDTMPCQQMEQVNILVDIAFQQRADLMAKQARLQESMLNKIKAGASFMPKIFLNGRGGYNKELQRSRFRDENGRRSNGNEGMQYDIALNFETPIFNGFDNIYQTRMAYADERISNEELIELQLNIALDVLTHSRNVLAAQEMLPDAAANLNNSQQAYEGVLEKYRAGKEGITEVSYAQQQLAAARIRYSDVKTRLLISIANLAYATGTLAPYMEIPCPENS